MSVRRVYNLMLGEDDNLEQRVIRQLVEQRLSNIRLVGNASTTTELLIWTHQKQAQLVILDSHLPGMPVATTLNLLLGHHPHLQVILMADYDEDRLMESCLRFGALTYLTRPASPTRIQHALLMATHVLDALA